MKRLGLLGGMSWESSIEYERIINEYVRDELGGVSSADLVIRSFNFAEIERLQEAGDWDGASHILAAAAVDLVSAGAEAIVLCTNTMHKLADDIAAAIAPVPLLHIADSTASAIDARGLRRVALLGTRYTMEQPFYAERLRTAHGLDVDIPSETEREDIHRIIYDELVRGIISDASRRRYLDIIRRMVDVGSQGVIAGCTEIELLISQNDISVPLFPTAALHARDAARFALTT